jgi:hypothetical protein
MKTKIPLTIVVTILTLLLTIPSALAQQPSPAPSQRESPFQMPDMGKILTGMFSESIKPERAAQLAHFQKLYYDALVKEGFTKEDAIDIVKGAAPSFGANR